MNYEQLNLQTSTPATPECTMRESTRRAHAATVPREDHTRQRCKHRSCRPKGGRTSENVRHDVHQAALATPVVGRLARALSNRSLLCTVPCVDAATAKAAAGNAPSRQDTMRPCLRRTQLFTGRLVARRPRNVEQAQREQTEHDKRWKEARRHGPHTRHVQHDTPPPPEGDLLHQRRAPSNT